MNANVINLNSVLTPEPRKAELAAWASKLAPQEGVNETGLSGVMIVRATSCTQPLPSLYDPCLCIVLQGRKRAVLGRETYLYDAFNYLVVSVSLPMAGQIIEASPERPYLCLRIPIDVTMIADLLAHVTLEPHSESPSDRGVFVARTSDAMLDAVWRLMSLLDEPKDVPVLAPLVLREIHYRALTGELGHRLQELCTVSGHMQRIARAIAYIKMRFAEPLRIESLAEALHMSVSSLHHHFKSITAMSPLQFQKHLRLHEARRLMLIEGIDAAAAGYRVGYESASQFSREYRRLFGAPPRREIEAVRV
jgi:AraC-like DNA-binding protein